MLLVPLVGCGAGPLPTPESRKGGTFKMSPRYRAWVIGEERTLWKPLWLWLSCALSPLCSRARD